MKKENGMAGVAEICLKVSGALTASVTHEIKNILSVINENAGLLEDLCSMTDEETGVPIEHVDAAAKTLMKQVGKSNIIMTSLNAFAHAGDRIPQQGDLHDILSLMISLTSRLAAMRKVSVTLSCPKGIQIQTNMLILESLVFVTLNRIYNACPEGCTLTIIGESGGKQEVVVRIAPEGGSSLESLCFPDIEEQILAKEIGSSCRMREGEIIIELAAL